jgi:predicted aldo/keto reductase-like oxidoreductase
LGRHFRSNIPENFKLLRNAEMFYRRAEEKLSYNGLKERLQTVQKVGNVKNSTPKKL